VWISFQGIKIIFLKFMKKLGSLKNNKDFEYLFFSRAYLILAYRGIEEVLSKVKSGNFSNPFDEVKPTDWVYENNYLLIPSIYDLKHAIEIFIKTLTHFLSLKPDEKHDFKILFTKLKSKISGKTVDELEELITRFYHNEFLIGKINNNIKIEDKMNDVFRYPDNKAKIELSFFHILPKFTENDLNKLEKDIKKLDKLFYLIGEKILERKYGPRPGLSKVQKTSNILKKIIKK